ncbi:ricin-type beta-trefoil lectin domain protein [Streptomyces sp. ADI98-10]|uniref:ricin-type beta-trefoil lectin domain protein n=1 Tax=Streptomyces sp. ADI98-10 TaxID=1522763 RepID=UPI000F5502C5|nr:ricin-type beta-trefoil lectin domain protein [Streptomyces sp. ADI98-10]RPK81287.1 Serine protease 1 precursor [Streptomyces sp. ADI98-10]
MTRSSQQTPASPAARAESGAESEGTAESAAPAASVGSAPSAVPDTAAVPAPDAPESERSAERKDPEAAAGTAGPEAAPPESAASEARPDTPEAGPGAPDADPAPDHGASAAAQSRLPALVRTMTATAIDRPQPQAGPVGRPGKAVLAGAAVAGALLVSVPFLVLAGNDDKGPEQPSTAAAGTVLDGSGQEAPGEFAVTAPETSPPGDGKGDEGKPRKPAEPVRQTPLAAPASGTDKDASKTDDTPGNPPKKADSPEAQPEKDDGAKSRPAKAAPAVTLSGPVSFRSHLSGRCIDVPGHNFNDGQPLFMWDCNGADAQKWRFASDGTIRVKDKCLDVANANFNDGTPIQIAWCNGADAQKFALNDAHDLVNTAVGKCVDIPDHSRSRGPETYLILWTCTGLDNQKWSV